MPRVLLGVDPRRRADGGRDHPPRGREGDACAHAVGAAGRRAEPVRQPLGQPPLDALGRHRHHLGGERVLRRHGEQLAERVGQRVGALGPMYVEHYVTSSGGAGGLVMPTN